MPPSKFLGSPYLQDSDLTIWNGDVREVLRSLPDESVQMCVTSPPYWGLRDYGTEGQIGLEPTPEAFVAAMVEVFREVRRVLRKDGTLWLNLGDSYASAPPGNKATGVEKWATSGLHGGVSPKYAATLDASVSTKRNTVAPGLKPKDLCMIPARAALALQADGWYLRSEITWCKPNPMPESVTDRPTQATEKVYLLSKNARYFYDAQAVAEPADWERWGDQTVGPGSNPDGWIKPKSKQELTGESRPGGRGDTYSGFNARYAADNPGERRTRNLRNWWEIATEPYPEAHFATYPQELVRRCILAGSAQGDVVLDPFAGSGTTAYVARKLARRSLLIELSEAYCELAARRTHQLSLEAVPYEPRPAVSASKGLTGGAYSPPGQTPHSNAREVA